MGEHSRIIVAQMLAASQGVALGHHLGDKAQFKALSRRHPPAGQAMPMAFLIGIERGRRCTPPAPAIRPTRGSGNAKIAFSAAMIMSHVKVGCEELPPIATPFTRCNDRVGGNLDFHGI